MGISSLIGKRILTSSGDSLGYVKSAYLSKNRRKLSCLVCFDEEEEEFILPARAITAAGDVIIAAKARLNEPTGVPCPIGSPAYSEQGVLLGAVSDFIPEGEEPEYVIVKDGVSTSYKASSVTPGATLMVNVGGKKKRRPPTKKQPAPPEQKNAEPARQEPAVPAKQEPIALPAQSYTGTGNGLDRCNLLGRTVKASVYDENGNAVILQGERITPEVIALARRKNLLLRLSINTLSDYA